MHVSIIINASPFTSSFILAMHNYVWHFKKNTVFIIIQLFSQRSTKALFLIILLFIVFLNKFADWEEPDGNGKYTSGSLFNWDLKLFFFLLQKNMYFISCSTRSQENVIFYILWYFYIHFSFESHIYSVIQVK